MPYRIQVGVGTDVERQERRLVVPADQVLLHQVGSRDGLDIGLDADLEKLPGYRVSHLLIREWARDDQLEFERLPAFGAHPGPRSQRPARGVERLRSRDRIVRMRSSRRWREGPVSEWDRARFGIAAPREHLGELALAVDGLRQREPNLHVAE